MKKTSFVVCCAISLIAPASQSQPMTPPTFLSAMPQPPTNVSEARTRCPHESDTLASGWLRALRVRELNEQSSIEKDSIKVKNLKRLPSVLLNEMNDYRSLQIKVDAQRDSLVARLQRLTSRTSQSLLTAIQTVGDELDRTIQNCPKVGAQQVYDSVCVEKAEVLAMERRFDACDTFLAEVRSEWNEVVEPLQRGLSMHESRIAELLNATKHPRLALQLKRLRLESWQTLAPILKTIDEVTRLAAQFAH